LGDDVGLELGHLAVKFDHGSIVLFEPKLHEFGLRRIETPLCSDERTEVLFGSIGSRLNLSDLFDVLKRLHPDNGPQNEAGVVTDRGRHGGEDFGVSGRDNDLKKVFGAAAELYRERTKDGASELKRRGWRKTDR
jgi:hypothetical protein